MKRFALKLVLFLLLGAIVTVAVAWGCVRYSLLTQAQPPDAAITSDSNRFAKWLDEGCLCTVNICFVAESRGFGVIKREGSAGDLVTHRPSRWENRWVEVGSGWPCIGLSGHMCVLYSNDYVNGTWVKTTRFSAARGLYQMTSQGWSNDLPYGPVPSGFAINTIFYAAILWLPFAAFGRIRCRRRIKRGLCPKCAYDLRGSQNKLCPECGGNASGAS